MEKMFGMIICSLFVIGMTLIIINMAEPAKRYKRFILTTILLPIIIFVLHRTCFFESVPHCKSCVIYEDGHKASVDANDLKNACINTYFILQFVLIPSVAKNIKSTGKMVLFIMLIIGLTFLLGFPVKVISYM